MWRISANISRSVSIFGWMLRKSAIAIKLSLNQRSPHKIGALAYGITHPTKTQHYLTITP
ncbi:hypothetical protein [Nostoc sp.]|uniref:hypothetical protein n=1 Tax=Nostoc sp. TaxID=1180 RepID=UPI002FF4C54D